MGLSGPNLFVSRGRLVQNLRILAPLVFAHWLKVEHDLEVFLLPLGFLPLTNRKVTKYSVRIIRIYHYLQCVSVEFRTNVSQH